jgi:hypothetical protein
MLPDDSQFSGLNHLPWD